MSQQALIPEIGAVTQLHFVVYAKPVPQGSLKGFVLPAKNGKKARAILTSDNTHLKPYRGDVTREAMRALVKANVQEPFAGKHVPVCIVFDFYLERPPTAPKKRREMVVKPDLDKLCRATIDAMSGVVFSDDAQIVALNCWKRYGTPERVEVSITRLEGSALPF